MTLEFGQGRFENNSLITLDVIGESTHALFCATDKKPCCNETDGNWYLPDGTLLPSETNTSQYLYVTREGDPTVGLNHMQNGTQPSAGIYLCELMDRKNITNHLYIGIYPQNGG